MSKDFDDRKAVFRCMRNWYGNITYHTLKHQMGWKLPRISKAFNGLIDEGSVTQEGAGVGGEWVETKSGIDKYEGRAPVASQLRLDISA